MAFDSMPFLLFVTLEQDWPKVELHVVDEGYKAATWAKLQGQR